MYLILDSHRPIILSWRKMVVKLTAPAGGGEVNFLAYGKLRFPEHHPTGSGATRDLIEQNNSPRLQFRPI